MKSQYLDGRPMIFGEVLFDCFPDGRRVLGGAPFNVAWHLQGFGMNPLFISRVGHDDLGAEIQDLMAQWGMDQSGLQIDNHHPTGTVQVTLIEGQPQYDIVSERAYDFIAWPEVQVALAETQPALLCHGSLIARHSVSRTTLDNLRQQTATPIFIDINLRRPWWQQESLNILLQGAHWLKLNDEELAILSQAPLNSSEQLAEAAVRVNSHYQLTHTWVTLGAEGALLVGKEGIQQGTPIVVNNLADTVGAGDAFTAVTILGLFQAWPNTLGLQRAIDFAAQICQMHGATPQKPNLYIEYLNKWSK